jgi:dephospho-CoA kinase
MYAEIGLSLGLSVISFIAGLTSERVKRSSRAKSIIILCSLGFMQGAIFKYFKSTRNKMISLSSVLVIFNIIGRNLQMTGLTGGVGCGKSSVVNIIRDRFKTVGIIDCDQISREIVRPGRKAYNEIIKQFGKDFLQIDGHINRERLGELIFDDPKSRKKLNRIMQPIIFWEILKKILTFRLKGVRVVICDAPLLFESKIMPIFCCPIITVYIQDKDLWISRLCQRDLIPSQQAKNKIGCQMPIEDKVRMSDLVINNTGSFYQLEGEVERIMRQLKVTK